MRQVVFSLCLVLAGFSAALAQGGEKGGREIGPIRSSSAFAEVSLRKVELEAEIESYLADYTEQNPKVIDARNELRFLVGDLDRIFAVRPTEVARLTEALGKMIVRRAALEADVERLMRAYSKDHPNVKRAKRKAVIFEASIREILG